MVSVTLVRVTDQIVYNYCKPSLSIRTILIIFCQYSAKSYWSILKTFYNGKKIPFIPPILISNKLVSNFKKKAKHFNAFFASQCTQVSNNSTLPLVTTPITNASSSSISFNDQDILNIIHSLDINKANGYDDLSIRLLKICDSSIVKPLSIIFKNCLESGSFPNN